MGAAARGIPMTADRTADVVIVGSGVAGALAAAHLAASGVKVLVLEAGPRVQRAQALEQFARALIKTPESPYPNEPYAPHPREDRIDDYYVQAGPDKFVSGYLRQVGGTTWHWLGTCLRFVPDDFRLRARFGVGVDWPISYADLEPWYCAAERELGVAGDGSAHPETPRSQPYPLPPIPMTCLDLRVSKALAGTFVVQPTPQARNSTPHDGRPPCCGSTSCIPICPIQAKYDATVHVARAERAGAELVEQAVVHLIEIGADRRVAAVRYKRPDGREERATGTVFVLAAHGIETPKLLLQSRSDARPAGVANSSDQVGRNLMDHPTQLSRGLAAAPLWPYQGPLSTAGIESPRAGDWRASRPAYRVQLGNTGWSWSTGTPDSTVRALVRKGLRGAALDRALADHSSRELELACMTEQLASPDNRIVPDFERRDALGIPRPRISFRIDEYTRRGLEEARRVHDRIFAALDSTEVLHVDDVKPAGHLMGTCRMGTNPKQSVVDGSLRAHDHPNLFVLGSSVFPTGGASNPTLTIAALALRAVETIRGALTRDVGD
jgi:choline dehydrogenase-like flavoprotein